MMIAISRIVPDETTFKIHIDGQIDDLYALALLLPEGAFPDFYAVTSIVGQKDRLFDKVTNAERRGCLRT